MFPMTNHTITLKTLLDSGIDIGLKDYPIWDENHRKVLNDKIITHYYLREIGQETPGLFIHYLNMKMNEIMPYYCELWKTTQYEYNPIHNADYTTEYIKTNKDIQTNKANSEGSSEGSSEGTNTSNSSVKGAKVDTPQSQLEVKEIDGLTAASELNYGKNSGEDKSSMKDSSKNSVNSTGESTMDGSESFKQHLAGNYGVKSTQAMIQEERDIILNIDMMIIAELQSCFMLIW